MLSHSNKYNSSTIYIAEVKINKRNKSLVLYLAQPESQQYHDRKYKSGYEIGQGHPYECLMDDIYKMSLQDNLERLEIKGGEITHQDYNEIPRFLEAISVIPLIKVLHTHQDELGKNAKKYVDQVVLNTGTRYKRVEIVEESIKDILNISPLITMNPLDFLYWAAHEDKLDESLYKQIYMKNINKFNYYSRLYALWDNHLYEIERHPDLCILDITLARKSTCNWVITNWIPWNERRKFE